MKVDLVIWTKNGAETLDAVLKRINRVIPKEFVNKRFIVDDYSTDKTRDIAASKGWAIHCNHGTGISDGANTALKFVEMDYFCSFEQDVLLSLYWWDRISRLIQKKDVVAACGLRFFPKDNLFYSIEPYQLIRKHIDYSGGFGKSLDNTLWNTKILRELGGFPKLKYAGVDSFLWRLIDAKGYKWLVDYGVQSVHLHSGFFKELKKHYFYGRSMPELDRKLSVFWSGHHEDGFSLFSKLVKSPASSFTMSRRMHDSRLMLVYPCTRLSWLLGYLRGKSL